MARPVTRHQEPPPVPPLAPHWRLPLSGVGGTLVLLLSGVMVGALERGNHPREGSAPTLLARPGRIEYTPPPLAITESADVQLQSITMSTPPGPSAPAGASSGRGSDQSQNAAPGAPIQGIVRRRGGIGSLGAPGGPLSAQLGDSGEVVGPQWWRAPLPAVVPGKPGAVAPVPMMPTSLQSELPDARTVELSRLANPVPQAQARLVVAVRGAAPAADRPVAVSLQVVRPVRGLTAGQPVTVRVQASTDCYLALIRVDATGRGSVVLRTPALSRSFSCSLRANAQAGNEYLLAVACAQPLSSGDVGAVVRAGSTGFGAPGGASTGLEPGRAWREAVGAAASLGGGAQAWQRFEWSIATASYATQPAAVPIQLAANPPEGNVPSVTPDGASVLPSGGNKSSSEQPKPQDKPALEKPAAQGAVAATSDAEKAAAAKAAAEKIVADKALADKAAAEKALVEKAAADKAAAEKAAADTAAAEHAAAEKAAADKAAAEKAAAEKAAAEKAAAEKAAVEAGNTNP